MSKSPLAGLALEPQPGGREYKGVLSLPLPLLTLLSQDEPSRPALWGPPLALRP